MADPISTLADHLAISPATITEFTLDKIATAVAGNYDITDPTSPFMQLIQANGMTSAAAMVRNDHADRKRYPSLALTVDELLPHLNGTALADVFSSPVRNHTVNFSMAKDELIENAIEDTTRGISFIEIPADTQFSAGGYDFLFHQPIEIRITPSGYVSAVFLDQYTSPLLTRVSNKVSVSTFTYDSTEFVNLAIPCDQLTVSSNSDVVTVGQPWTISLTVTDLFTFARGWYLNASGVWVELNVKFDRTYYDPSTPTMILELTGNTLIAYIPDIYITNGMVGSRARVDLYTTKGYSSINLSSSATSDWDVNFQDFSNLSGTNSDPLLNIVTRMVFSDDKTTGGTDGMTFEEVRKQVVYGDGIKLGAYTRDELVSELATRGYRGILRKDTITGRVYVAGRSIDNPDTLPSTGLSSGIGVTNAKCTFDQNSENFAKSMISNTDCCVIKPDALYKVTNSTAAIMTDVDRTTLEDMLTNGNRETFVTELNRGIYSWSMLHTVLDYSTPLFTVRQYDLSSPAQTYTSIKDNNWMMGYAVDTSEVSMSLVSQSTNNKMPSLNLVSLGMYSDVQLTSRDQFQIKVHGTFPKGVDNLHAQLTLTYGGKYYYLDSTVDQTSETDAIFTFTLWTNLDIDVDNNFSVVMTSKETGQPAVVRINLETELGIVYMADTNNVFAYPNMDNLVDLSGYNGGLASTINMDLLGITFGSFMDGLYNYGRTLLNATQYQKHTAAKQAVWSKDVPARDPVTNDIIYTVDNTVTPNTVTVQMLYTKGTPRVDANGDPVWEYQIGDLVLDADGQPIPIAGAASPQLREVRIHLMDARFRYTTTQSVLDYVAAVPSTILSYLTKDVANLGSQMLELTKLYYEPLSTRSTATVITEDISAGTLQDLAVEIGVTFQLTKEGYLDESFKASLKTLAKSVIVTQLNTGAISTTVLRKALYDLDRDKILTVTVSTPFGSDVHAYIKNNDGAFSLDKKLTLQPNDTITIADTLVINFTK